MTNADLSMALKFNAQSMNVDQSEFISFEHFLDQSCKIYETLWKTFEVDDIHVLSFRVLLQKGFRTSGEAEEFIRESAFFTASSSLHEMLGGEPTALRGIFVTEEDIEWDGVPAHQRHRIEISSIRQIKQQSLDSRMLQRARLLPRHQNDAIVAIQKLREKHPEMSENAAQFDLERSLETEFSSKTFDMPKFLADAWNWAESCCKTLQSGKAK